MTKALAFAALFALSFDHGHCQHLAPPPAQPSTTLPAFEVASITPCEPGTPEPPGEHAGMVQFTYPGGRFNAKATTVRFLLEWAYGIQSAQHTGGPAWLGTDRYDIVAKAEANASDDQIKQMVQTLLADRFKLQFHRETRELPVYVISLGKSAPKLFPPKEGGQRSLRMEPRMDIDHKTSFHIVATRFSLTQLTDTFARQMGRVIVNQTGFDDDYDFTLDLTPDESHPSALDASLLIDAIRNQLGLDLKSQKAPVEVMVIDNVEKVAAGNVY
jgi:uncharacterized protein (TIGR03435 family)